VAPDRNQLLAWILSLPGILLLCAVGLIPIAFPIFSKYEGQWLPVVTNVETVALDYVAEGILVDVEFDKVRQCEFIGISWYDSFRERVPIVFNPEPERPETTDLPRSRPVMEDQRAGPWLLLGIDTLDGSIAIVSHRCHPYWITYSMFYQ
jgi:hypothetical protein